MNFDKILFLDFADSFSANIKRLLERVSGQEIEMVNYQDFHSRMIPAKGTIVLGPGPGHVYDYAKFLKKFKLEINSRKLNYFGICLGHQLLWTLLGGEVGPAKEKMHGRTVTIKVPAWPQYFPKQSVNKKIYVQRYNSWSITPQNLLGVNYLRDLDNQDIQGFTFKNVLGLQFHPESVGTQYPDLFVDWLRNSQLQHKHLSEGEDELNCTRLD